MVDLNSILLEGFADGVEVHGMGKGAKCIFTLLNTRETTKCRVKVVTKSFLAETCMKRLEKGRKIRVVGRLAQDGLKTFILAEHVEFMPMIEGRPLPTPKNGRSRECQGQN